MTAIISIGEEGAELCLTGDKLFIRKPVDVSRGIYDLISLGEGSETNFKFILSSVKRLSILATKKE